MPIIRRNNHAFSKTTFSESVGSHYSCTEYAHAGTGCLWFRRVGSGRWSDTDAIADTFTKAWTSAAVWERERYWATRHPLRTGRRTSSCRLALANIPAAAADRNDDVYV